MKHILVELMAQMTELSDAEESAIERSFPIELFKKGTLLLKQGEIAKNFYYLISGCIREFELICGEEKTTAFYTENQSVANFNSMINQVPSAKCFICNEDVTVVVGDPKKEEELYREFPRFESFCRLGMEQMIVDKQGQISELITMKPKDRYEKLQLERPDLLNRVPQYQIASYLGITPEALSRIRGRTVKK